MKVRKCGVLRSTAGMACVLLAGSWPALAQSMPQAAESSGRVDTDARIVALDKSLRKTRAELAQTRAEVAQLRSLLEELNQRLSASGETSAIVSLPSRPFPAAAPSPSAQAAASSPSHPARISEDDWQVLNAKVDQQDQDKVASGSKYRLQLSGLALFNAYRDVGQVDNQDVPTLAQPRSEELSSGSLGASIRQSIVGLAVTGPDLLGARTSADMQMDFFGGLPSGYGAGTSGIARLRLARLRFDWARTSVVGGLDTPFFSPNVPTSYMSVAVPAFALAGNLWNWAPTLLVEQRFPTGLGQFKVEAGFLDPSGYATAGSAVRHPSPGESSRQPVYAVRVSANGSRGDRPASVGISGVYLPQRFAYVPTVSGWGGILDWRFPLVPHTELSGEFFAGQGLDSLGGVPIPYIQTQDYNEYIQVGAPALARIPMMGGWSQLKFMLNSRNEFNVAIGAGDWKASELAAAAVLDPALARLSPRNEMLFANYIFRPRSDLLFSAEYRRLRTYPLSGVLATANQVGLAAGFLF